MKVLVIGGKGMLGHKLVQRFAEKFDLWTTIRGHFQTVEKYGFFRKAKTIEHLDIFEFGEVEKTIEQVLPDVVVNCVGIIKQLPVSKDVINTLTINSIVPHRLAQLGEKFGFRLINISTDCVFKGTKGNYREEDEADAADLYGKSKYLGEVLQENCLTIRTSIIGHELETAHSLVDWFLSNEGGKVKGFTRAIYTGFPTVVFADIIADLIINQPDLAGLYHISSKPINKYDLLNLVKNRYGANIEIEPFDDFRIDRSLNSDKFRRETGFAPLAWEEMIEIMAADHEENYADWKK